MEIGTGAVHNVVPAGSETWEATVDRAHDFDFAIFVELDLLDIAFLKISKKKSIGCSLRFTFETLPEKFAL